MPFRPAIWICLPLLLACAGAENRPTATEPVTARIRWAQGDDGSLFVDDARIGQLAGGSDGWELVGGQVRARIDVRRTRPGTASAGHPVQVVLEGALDGLPVTIRDAYRVLAPAAPLPVEGYGLVVSDDEPGTNDREHARLREWLGDQGLPADSTPFQTAHQRETGRELRVWYEMSGRRVGGRLTRGPDRERGADRELLASVDSLFRSQDGQLKIHHQRPGENGRFRYHRQSLELADVIAAPGEPDLVVHECGCYGYAIAADFTTLGDLLYQVEADWLDDRVGAGFFLGIERRARFPWIGLGDRLRMRNLARRATAFILRDPAGEVFARVDLQLPADPPSTGLGPIAYHIEQRDAVGARQPLAVIRYDGAQIEIDVLGPEPWPQTLERLDGLLAAMPVQVIRGDDLRDSQLGRIEQLVDALRLLRAPDEARLVDFVSDVDASAAARKVRALLSPERARFAVAPDALPDRPMHGPGALARMGSR